MTDYKQMAIERLDAGGFLKETAKQDYDTIIEAYSDTVSKPRIGMMFVGGVGCGKTMAMKLLATNARFVDLADIESQDVLQSFDVFEEGVAVNRWWLIYFDRTVILDDLGNEPIKSDYGRKIEVVSNFIMKWYCDIFKREDKHARLLITTNLSTEQLIQRYGARVIDRLLEMVSPVNFANTSKRPYAKSYGVTK
jgi:hypothetical protein